MYSSSQAAAVYHVSNETIRNWSEEFSRYLSFMANPGKGRTRSFSDEDMQVLALIAEMKANGSTFEEIHISLGRGQRGDAPALQVEEVKAMISGEQERRLMLEIEYLKRSLQDSVARSAQAEELKEKYIRLEAQVEIIKQTDAARIEALTDELGEARKRIEELSRQIGESYAKGFIEALERKGDVSRSDVRKQDGGGE
jgi:DNA-binding transcriptional MerR regulator